MRRKIYFIAVGMSILMGIISCGNENNLSGGGYSLEQVKLEVEQSEVKTKEAYNEINNRVNDKGYSIQMPNDSLDASKAPSQEIELMRRIINVDLKLKNATDSIRGVIESEKEENLRELKEIAEDTVAIISLAHSKDVLVDPSLMYTAARILYVWADSTQNAAKTIIIPE